MRDFMAINHFIFKTFSYVVLTGFLLGSTVGYGQSFSKPDSLEQVYLKGAFRPEDSLKILHDLAIEFEDPQKILQ